MSWHFWVTYVLAVLNYSLRDNTSPRIDRGLDFGLDIVKDYFGNELEGRRDIGASEYISQ